MLCNVELNGKWGYIDAKGNFAINPQFNSATPFGSQSGLAAVLVNGKWGLIDSNGKYVVNPQFDEVQYNLENN